MRPVFINGKFCAQRVTGVQRYALNVVMALDAHLVSLGEGAVPWTLLLPAGIAPPALRAVRVRHLPWTGPGGLSAWEQLALPHAARSGLLLNLAGSAPAWGTGRRLCVLHDAGPFDEPHAYSRIFRTWYRALFRRLARDRSVTLVTVSAAARDRLAQALHREDWSVVRGGAGHLDGVVADNSVLTAHGLDRQPFLLAVGSHNPRKNLARLLEAWRLLDRRDLRLVLVGGVDRRVFAAAGMPTDVSGVLDLGNLDDPGLKALLQRARGLVFPSLYEGFGLPPLEAMSCGCPAAVSDIPALREVCADAALRFDPLAPDDIARAMRRLIDDPILRTTLRVRGLARAAALTWSDAALALFDLAERARR